MKKWIWVVMVCGLLVIIGCSEEQMQQVDRAAQDAEVVVEAAESVLASPAGQLVPPDVRLYASLAGALLLGLANAWQAFRHGQTQKALSEVVVGNEAVKKGKDFADAQNAAQSVSTTQRVAFIRRTL